MPKDPILGGELIHGKARLKKIDALLKRIEATAALYAQDGMQAVSGLYNQVFEARQLEASRIGKKKP